MDNVTSDALSEVGEILQDLSVFLSQVALKKNVVDADKLKAIAFASILMDVRNEVSNVVSEDDGHQADSAVEDAPQAENVAEIHDFQKHRAERDQARARPPIPVPTRFG